MNRTGWRLGLSLFWHKGAMQAVIVLMLTCTLVVTNALTTLVYQQTAATRRFRGFDNPENTAFFFPQDETAAQGIWNELDDTAYETVSKRSATDATGRNMTLMLYGARTAEGLGVPISGAQEGRIPCAASAPYRVGDVIETSLYNQHVVLQVVERLRAGDVYPSFTTLSNRVDFGMVCETVSEQSGAVVLFCRDLLPHAPATRAADNAIVFFDGAREENVTRLQTAGWVVPLNEAHTYTNEELRASLAAYLPLGVTTFLIGIVSLAGVMMILILRQMRTWVVFEICGMSRWQLGCIGRAYGLSIALLAALLAAAGWFTVVPELLDVTNLAWPNAVVTLLLLALPVALADGIPRRLVPREDPLTALAKGEAA